MKKSIFVFASALTIGFFSCKDKDPEACCSCKEQTGVYSPYVFPSTTEYRTLPYPEKLTKLQIPDQTLKRLCTSDLVETYLTYPFINTLGHSNNFKSTFKYLLADFNGARELVNREDGATQLQKRHQSYNFSNFNLSWQEQKQFDYKWNLMLLELTLSQNQILSKLSIQSKNDLFKSVMIVLKRREIKPELFEYTNNGSNDFLIANVLFSIGYLPFKDYVQANSNVLTYINGSLEGTIQDKERLQIRMFANNYLNTLPQ